MNNIELIDSHCHIDMLCEKDTSKYRDVLDSASQNHVSTLLSVCVTLEEFDDVHKGAMAYDNIYCSVGLHPCYEVAEEPSFEDYMERASRPKVIAIGEAGLDYHYIGPGKAIQRKRLETQLQVATDTRKPIIIHTREAREDTVAILKSASSEHLSGIIHCFTEDWETARKFLDIGFHISFSGITTFKSADSIREVVRNIPADRYLIETDSPYLAPVPHRGKQNQPAFVKHVAECIAQERGETFEEVAAQSTANFKKLFQF